MSADRPAAHAATRRSQTSAAAQARPPFAAELRGPAQAPVLRDTAASPA